jgi:2,5-diketo-D-gluconate reductase B
MGEAHETVTVQGVEIPALGFGTWQLRGKQCYEGVRHALEVGYRHLDTAQMYGNEADVGQAVADSGVDREDVFLVTKIPPSNLAPEAVRSSHEESLRKLRTDYVDLLLIHWPSDSVPLESTLEAMTELRARGRTRHVGVSNFGPELVERALRRTPVLANQVEYHPYVGQSALLEQCRERDITLTAYSPLAEGRVARDVTLREIGDRHGKTAAQVAIRWLLQQEKVTVIPRSGDGGHRAANWDVWDFSLSDEEIDRVGALRRAA